MQFGTFRTISKNLARGDRKKFDPGPIRVNDHELLVPQRILHAARTPYTKGRTQYDFLRRTERVRHVVRQTPRETATYMGIWARIKRWSPLSSMRTIWSCMQK